MKRLLSHGLAILSLAGTVLATAAPALADGDYRHDDRGGQYSDGRNSDGRDGDHWRGDGRDWHERGDGDHERRDWRHGYWGGDYGGRQCVVHRRVWDPYDGRYERRTVRYNCGRSYR